MKLPHLKLPHGQSEIDTPVLGLNLIVVELVNRDSDFSHERRDIQVLKVLDADLGWGEPPRKLAVSFDGAIRRGRGRERNVKVVDPFAQEAGRGLEPARRRVGVNNRAEEVGGLQVEDVFLGDTCCQLWVLTTQLTVVIDQLDLQLCTAFRSTNIVFLLRLVPTTGDAEPTLRISDLEEHALDGIHARRLAQHTDNRLMRLVHPRLFYLTLT